MMTDYRPPATEESGRYLETQIEILHMARKRSDADMCELKDDLGKVKEDIGEIKTDVAIIKKSTEAYSKWIWLAGGAITISALNAIWGLLTR